MNQDLLQIIDLKKHFALTRGVLFKKRLGVVRAVDGVNLNIKQQETLGLVGESGCGKTTLGRTVMQLTPPTSGKIIMNGTDLAGLSYRNLRKVRRDFQMIFQDPYASLNPRMTVFDALAEPLRTHKIVPSREVDREVSRLMQTVGLASRFIKKYPHEFSGGQRQRIAIARALALRPQLIIADEPVSALDVSIQAQILNLLSDLRESFKLTMLFISHDLSVVRHVADRIAVMYLGRIVELAPAAVLFETPKHPYTRALISAVPLPDPRSERQRKRLILTDDPPSPLNPPSGCPFHPRCPFVKDACRTTVQTLTTCGSGHEVACMRQGEI